MPIRDERGIFKKYVDFFSLKCNIWNTPIKHTVLKTSKPLSAFYKNWNNDKHLTIYQCSLPMFP